jgi:hypothetical protein
MSLRPAPQVRASDRWRVAIVAYAAVAALCQPLTLPAVVAVLLAAVGLFVLIPRRTRTAARSPGRSRAALMQWSAVALAVVGWEFVAFAWGNDADHPTLSLLLDPVLDTYPGRLAGWLLWLGAARWLVSR